MSLNKVLCFFGCRRNRWLTSRRLSSRETQRLKRQRSVLNTCAHGPHSPDINDLIQATASQGWHEQKDVMKWLNNSKEINIFITGKTGVGKSTLVNGLLGAKVAKEDCMFDLEVTEVNGYEKEFENESLKVTVWESSGLQDGTSKEAQYLANMKKRCSDMDICIYCVSMMVTRFYEGCPDIIAMKKLTAVFGRKMWENSVFVLTFANTAEDLDSHLLEADDGQKPDMFKTKVQLWKERLVSVLINDGIEEAVANRVEVVPVGHAIIPELLDRDHWLNHFWFATLHTMTPRAQPAMLKLIFGCILKEIPNKHQRKFIDKNLLVMSEHGAVVKEKFWENEVERAIGCKIRKGASVLEPHSILMEIAKQLQQTFQEYIKEKKC